MAVRDDVRTGGTTPCDHRVVFYESRQYLVDSTADFLAEALDRGETAVAIATREHLTAIEQVLAAAGTSRGQGALVALEAQATLDRFMVDGDPDPATFFDVIGDILDGLPASGGQPHVFGEMVAVLWEQGNVTGALAVEDLWNDLARSRSFLLSCAYPIQAFDSEAAAADFRSICMKHSSVTAAERDPQHDPADRARQVAALRQELAAVTRERHVLQRRHDEVEASLRRLEELERVRTEFVAMVVHDVRTPAGVVSAALELLRDAWPQVDDEDSHRTLVAAAESTELIHRLIDDLQLMSQLDADAFSFQLSPGHLDGVVGRAISEVQGATGRAIEVDLPHDLPQVLIDEDRQVQILANLLSNAVKFSSDDAAVHLAVEDQDHRIVVRVHDRGVGIAPEHQERLFQPFSRLGTTASGTGLGLYIARTLVEGQGGTIWVDSTPEDGTTFSYSVVTSRSRD